MGYLRARLIPLWLTAIAYAVVLAWYWKALPHSLVIRFTTMDAPARVLPRAWFALVTLAALCALIEVFSLLAPREGEFGRGAVTLSFGFVYGMTGFAAGVFFSLVRVNAGLGSPVRPAMAISLAYVSLGLVLGVSAPAPLRRRRHSRISA